MLLPGRPCERPARLLVNSTTMSVSKRKPSVQQIIDPMMSILSESVSGAAECSPWNRRLDSFIYCAADGFSSWYRQSSGTRLLGPGTC